MEELVSSMAETLGTLSDKLTIVKLKQYHTEDSARLASLKLQEAQLQQEIDEYVAAAMAGDIPLAKLTFAANKVYKKEGNDTRDLTGSLGQIFGFLADTNCQLWHVQEKVYEFEAIPVEQKDEVIKELAILNLERNNCIDEIDKAFVALLRGKANG